MGPGARRTSPRKPSALKHEARGARIRPTAPSSPSLPTEDAAGSRCTEGTAVGGLGGDRHAGHLECRGGLRPPHLPSLLPSRAFGSHWDGLRSTNLNVFWFEVWQSVPQVFCVARNQKTLAGQFPP